MISVNQHLLAAIKRTAKNSNIYYKKIVALQKKIDALVEEYNDYSRIYESWEQPVREMTNGLTSRDCLEIITNGGDLNKEIEARRKQITDLEEELRVTYLDAEPQITDLDLEDQIEQKDKEELNAIYSENEPCEETAVCMAVHEDELYMEEPIAGHQGLPAEYYNENI